MIEYRASADYLTRALAVTPGGAQTQSKRADRFPLGAFPTALCRGHGAWVWDLDGRRYVDWIGALGPITLGYAHPAVVEAVEKQIRDGMLFSLPHPLEAEVAERLLAVVPCGRLGGQVRWLVTGSEACEAAVRVARLATGRDLVLSIGYHGWHSWAQAGRQQHPGIPEAMVHLIHEAPYNDLDSAEAWMARPVSDLYTGLSGRRLGDMTAAIFVEPVLGTPPSRGYLRGLRNLAHRYGALLIFDEVVTGLRWAVGGAQEYFGVTPDLATFGKALGGGLPLAALVGPVSLMQHAWAASGTFNGSAVSLAAARAVLEVYAKEGVIGALWEAGAVFQEAVNTVAASRSIDLRAGGYPCHPVFHVEHSMPRQLLLSLLLQEAADRGVLFHPAGCNPSLAHATPEARDVTQMALLEAVAVVADAWADGGEAGLLKALRGGVAKESPLGRSG